MKKELENILKESMNGNLLDKSEEIPELNAKTLNIIKARKPSKKNNVSVFLSIIDKIFSAYKIPLAACLILITLLLINKSEFTTHKVNEITANNNAVDTVLTVSSNTFLASLHQPTFSQLPAKTHTALTCITTIVCKN